MQRRRLVLCSEAEYSWWTIQHTRVSGEPHLIAAIGEQLAVAVAKFIAQPAWIILPAGFGRFGGIVSTGLAMLLGARQKSGSAGRVAGLLTALIGVLCPLAAQSAGIGQTSRIASVNLCADQLLLALAPASRIAALGPFARDPAVSFLANRAKEFPQLSGRSEELVMVRADAFMVGPFDNKHMRSMLDRRGAPVLMVNRWGASRRRDQGDRRSRRRNWRGKRGQGARCRNRSGVAEVA